MEGGILFTKGGAIPVILGSLLVSRGGEGCLLGRNAGRVLLTIIGSLRNYDSDAKDNVDEKMNLYFTHESRDTVKSFTLFITAKTIAKLNPEHSVKFEIKILKIGLDGSRSSDNAKFGHFTLLS